MTLHDAGMTHIRQLHRPNVVMLKVRQYMRTIIKYDMNMHADAR